MDGQMDDATGAPMLGAGAPAVDAPAVGAAANAVAAVLDCVTNHPRHRELLYRALVFCGEPRARADAEAFIASQPEYAQALQEAFVLLRDLERAGGVAPVPETPPAEGSTREKGAVSADPTFAGGATPTPSPTPASTPAPAPLRTTPAGVAAVALLDPRRRIEACLGEDPARADMLVAVLGFCREPRRLADVRQFVARSFAGRLQTGAAGHELDATYFIDRLAEVGALVWKDRTWVATEDGMRYLSSL